MELKCNHCGETGSPHLSEKGIHVKAVCKSCGCFIKFVPKDRSSQTDFTIYFGKYKGKKVSELKSEAELAYLKWLLLEGFLKPWQLSIIQNYLGV